MSQRAGRRLAARTTLVPTPAGGAMAGGWRGLTGAGSMARAVAAAGVAALALAGCGQKGPLRLPAAVEAPAASTAPTASDAAIASPAEIPTGTLNKPSSSSPRPSYTTAEPPR